MFQRLALTFTNGDKEIYFLEKQKVIVLERKDSTVFLRDPENNGVEVAINHIRCVRFHQGSFYKLSDTGASFYIP